MKTTNSRHDRNTRDALEAVRAWIEEEFTSLSEDQPRLLRLALNEAEAIAWQSGFPELLFPALAVEKAEQVAAWHRRQTSLLRRQPVISFAA